MRPATKKTLDRLIELRDRGEALSRKGRHQKQNSGFWFFDDPADEREMRAWITSTRHVLDLVFGPDGRHPTTFGSLGRYDESPSRMRSALAALDAAIEDIEAGFIDGIETRITADVVDDVLEYAEEMLDDGHKDPAAVLGRVAIETFLGRLSANHELDNTVKASSMNAALKQAGVYGKPQWRQISAWLDIGNDAAHGSFESYNADEVRLMLSGFRLLSTRYLT